jgi:hypothetical protein
MAGEGIFKAWHKTGFCNPFNSADTAKGIIPDFTRKVIK